MKPVNYFFIFLIITLFACGGNKSQNENKEKSEIKEELIDDSTLKEAKNCDEFIDQYEKWMNDYIVLLDKYMKNPMDPKLMEQYMKIAQESMNWMNQWNSKLAYCASKEKYQKRFDEISEKAEKKLKELGLE